MSSTTKEVITHHLTAFGSNDLEEILKDYTAASELFTPTGILQSLETISQFFADYFIAVPTGSDFKMKQFVVKENIAYINWSSNSAVAEIPVGTDTFILEGDKIKYHTVADYRIKK